MEISFSLGKDFVNDAHVARLKSTDSPSETTAAAAVTVTKQNIRILYLPYAK